jgi:alcohol dehydrogenase
MPTRPAGFALLKLLAGGICNTDLELQRGYYGFSGTPGHEFVAGVLEADESPGVKAAPNASTPAP